MENFNRLIDIIKTFHIGIVCYESQSYWVCHNPIIHHLYPVGEINDLIKKPIEDLLNLKPVVAKKKIKHLPVLISEIAKYKNGVNNNEDALNQFVVNCESYGLKVTQEYSAIEHFEGKIADRFIITSYFLNDLDHEIRMRALIVDRLELRLNQEINGIEPENLSIYEPSKWATRNYGIQGPGEMKWKDWAKILEADNYIEKESIQMNEDRDNTKGILPSDRPIPQEYGFECYLTDPLLIEKLTVYKNLNKPQKIVLMVFALKELNKFHNDPTGSATTLFRALEQSFGNIGRRQSIEYNLKIFRDSNMKNYRRQQIDLEKQAVKQLVGS